MTDQEINRAVAESVGDDRWLIVKRGYFYRPNGHGYTSHVSEAWALPLAEAKKHEYLIGEEPVTLRKAPIPDYCNDLNAMHDVENRMTDDEHLRFRNALWLLIIKTTQFPHHVSRNVHSATARQRAEAYLRTIGKWRDA